METKHTEWYVGPSTIYDGNGKSIAVVFNGDAHGAVLAAAPDLLAACKMVAATGVYNEKTNSGVWAVDGPTVQAVLAAIAKAQKGSR